MKKICLLLSFALLSGCALQAQNLGNSIFGGPQYSQSSPGDLFALEPKDSTPVSFVEARVLLNLKADAWQAVFALAQQTGTVPESYDKVAAQAAGFVSAIEALGVKPEDVYIDAITQNRVYDFDVHDNVAQEKLTGFVVKKNVIVRYQDPALLDKMLAAAASSSIYDLVKVNYIVNDLAGAQARLREAAAKVIQEKEQAYARLLGVKLRDLAIYQEKFETHYPADMYKSYQASESGNADGYNMRVVRATKLSTYYYSALDPADFDAVLTPASVEPEVQMTLYLKVRCLARSEK